MTLSKTLFETNRIPTSKERDVIKGLLESTDQRLAEIRQTIAKYQDEEAALVAARTSYRSALSPIRSLPLDILSEIFFACVDSARFPMISPSEAPMLLTHICHKFRQLAFSIPALWARMHIRFDPINLRSKRDSEWKIQRGRTLVDGAQEWLRRSGKSPLFISFQASSGSYAGLTEEMVGILLEYTARWKHISLSFLPNVPLIKRFATLTAADVPLLTSLVLHQCEANEHHEYSNWDILRAPKLKHFVMRGDDIESTALNWSKFTSLGLELVRTPIQTVIQILLQASNLVKCTLSFDYSVDSLYDLADSFDDLADSFDDSADESPNLDEIFMPNLELLELQSFGNSNYWGSYKPSFLSAIHTPKLVRLCICIDINDPGIEEFFRRHPNLREVVVLCQASSYELRPEWLRFCPQITSLTLGLPMFDMHSDTLGYYPEDFVPDDVYFQRWRLQQPDTMLDELLVSFIEHEDNHEVLCPNLHTFICYFPVLENFEVLCAFLQFQEGAGSLPDRQWKHVGLRVELDDGNEKQRGILLDKGRQLPMQFDFALI